ncbi:MarR family winged helix-turn-helix transcriptional regulator [Salinispora arenicola]|uniref:MarR family winged helix-turn-helix transcriptional regulator n=1 Tax=Salinispora arenicola TaxID=168697 RepID=UPI0003A6FDBF|nr:MarR family winged helix-turn-helix transcriptional regulator [Salinispora arenicola]
MTDAPEPVPAHAMFKVLAALAELGEDTAAAVADKAGLGYSTATAKLRAWEKTGQAERVYTDSKRAVWRLTDAGRATVGADQAPPPAQDGAPDEPADPACHDDPAEIADTPAGPEVTPTPNPATPAGGETPPPADDPAAPPDREAVEAIAADAGGDRRDAASEDGPDTVTPATRADPPAASSRRTKGSLRGAVLDILEAHPDQAYKTGELCKLVDAANAGTDAKKVSAGAVVNAADKLVETGKAVRTVEKPATFQLAPAAR